MRPINAQDRQAHKLIREEAAALEAGGNLHFDEMMNAKNQPEYVLFATLRSPFARRIRLALARTGRPHEVKMIDAFAPTPEFLKANPLGLIPALVDVKTGVSYPDSNAILEVLHVRHGGSVWPSKTESQIAVRRQSTLAAGLMTATVARYLEKSRERPDPSWLQDHEEALRRTLAQIELGPIGAPGSSAEFTQADWDLAVALEYLDLRHAEWNWRAEHPRLEGWIRMASDAPEFIETRPPPA